MPAAVAKAFHVMHICHGMAWYGMVDVCEGAPVAVIVMAWPFQGQRLFIFQKIEFTRDTCKRAWAPTHHACKTQHVTPGAKRALLLMSFILETKQCNGGLCAARVINTVSVVSAVQQSSGTRCMATVNQCAPPSELSLVLEIITIGRPTHS